MLALLEPIARGKVYSVVTTRCGYGGRSEPALHGHELRDLAYELLRRIEHRLGALSNVSDADIAATVAKCEQALAEIKANVQPRD